MHFLKNQLINGEYAKKRSQTTLKFIQNISSYGIFPRDILLNKSEEYIMVANQKSNNIVIFNRNVKDSILNRIEGADVKMEKPSFKVDYCVS